MRIRIPPIENLRHASWLSLGNLALRLSQLLLYALVLRSTSTSSYGQLALANAVVSFGIFASEGGFLLAITSNPSLTLEDERAAAGRGYVFGILFAVVDIIVAVALGTRHGYGAVPYYVAPLSIAIVLAAPASIAEGRLQKRRQYKNIGLSQTSSAAVAFAVGFALYATGHPIPALIAQTMISTSGPYLVLLSMASEVAMRPRLRERRTSSAYRDFRVAAKHALYSNALGVIGRRSDDLIIGLFTSPAELGQYALGYRVLTVATETILHPYERVTVGLLAESRADRAASEHIGARRQKALARFGVIAFGLGALASPLLVPWIFGDKWRLGAWCAAALCTAGVFQSTYWLTFARLFSLRSHRAASTYQSFLIPMLLCGVFVGLPFGIVWSSWGYAIASGSAIFVSRIFLKITSYPPGRHTNPKGL